MPHCILQVLKYLYTVGENVLKIQRIKVFFFSEGGKKKINGSNMVVIPSLCFYPWQHLAASVFSKMKGA